MPFGSSRSSTAEGAVALAASEVSVKGWSPDEKVCVDVEIRPEPDVKPAPGDYELALAVIDPRTQQPAIRLAIEGRDQDGCYALGRVTVE